MLFQRPTSHRMQIDGTEAFESENFLQEPHSRLVPRNQVSLILHLYPRTETMMKLSRLQTLDIFYDDLTAFRESHQQKVRLSFSAGSSFYPSVCAV